MYMYHTLPKEHPPLLLAQFLYKVKVYSHLKFCARRGREVSISMVSMCVGLPVRTKMYVFGTSSVGLSMHLKAANGGGDTSVL